MDHLDLLRLCIGAWILWGVYWFVAAFTVNRTKSSEGVLLRMQHQLPLLIGSVLIFRGSSRALFFGRIHHSNTLGILGTALTILGLLFSLWSRIHLGKYWSGIITLKEGHKLIRTGPYRVLRHPLYTGFLCAILGSALVVATGDALIGFVLILIAFLIKMRREEAVLSGQFAEEYRQFQRETWALIPFVY